MIEENNPEINVDELMQKIWEEVAKRQGNSQEPSITTSKPERSSMATNFNPIFKQIETLLNNADFRGSFRTKWPDNLNKFPWNSNKNLQKLILNILNFLFKDQREVNFNLIRAIKESVSLNRQLIEQVTSLRAQMDEHRSTVNTRIQGIDERLNTVFSRVPTIDDKLNKIDTYINSWMTGTEERLDAVNSQAQLIDERLSTADTRLQGMDERLSTADTHLQGMDERLSTVDTRLQGMDERLSTADTHLQGMDERLSTADTRLQGMDERHLRNDSYLKNDLVQQKRLITMFLEEARRRLPEPFNQEQLQTFVHEEQHLPDAFYVAFEDQFRGKREDIVNRLTVYLPLIAEAKVGTPSSPVLDVGCGRGEWLELLRESGYTARGIDINRVMLDHCRARGLEVMESDVIAYLQSLPDTSLGVVTGFHILEHLPFPVLTKLLDETVRVLKSGGLAIFETPNPRNLLVGSGDFYRDPTHKNPIHPDTIRFIAESKGFVRSESYFFAEKDGCSYLSKSSQARFDNLNDYINISRDYAMVAYKP